MAQAGEQAVDQRELALFACAVIVRVGGFLQQFREQAGKHLDQPAPPRVAGKVRDIGTAGVTQLQRELAGALVEE